MNRILIFCVCFAVLFNLTCSQDSEDPTCFQDTGDSYLCDGSEQKITCNDKCKRENARGECRNGSCFCLYYGYNTKCSRLLEGTIVVNEGNIVNNAADAFVSALSGLSSPLSG